MIQRYVGDRLVGSPGDVKPLNVLDGSLFIETGSPYRAYIKVGNWIPFTNGSGISGDFYSSSNPSGFITGFNFNAVNDYQYTFFSGGMLTGSQKLHFDGNTVIVSGNSPAGVLNVFEGQLRIKGSETDGAADKGGVLSFFGDDGSANRSWGFIRGMKENSVVGNTNSYISMATRTNSDTLREVFRINSSGYVGILKQNQTQALDVNGNVLASGLILPNGAVNGYYLRTNSQGVTSWINLNTGQFAPIYNLHQTGILFSNLIDGLSGQLNQTGNNLQNQIDYIFNNTGNFITGDLYWGRNNSSNITYLINSGDTININHASTAYKLNVGGIIRSDSQIHSDASGFLANFSAAGGLVQTGLQIWNGLGACNGVIRTIGYPGIGSGINFLSKQTNFGGAPIGFNGILTFGSQDGNEVAILIDRNNRIAINKIGIPQRELDVNGSIRGSGIQLVSGASNNYYLKSDSNGNASWFNLNTGQFASRFALTQSGINLISRDNSISGVINTRLTNTGINLQNQITNIKNGTGNFITGDLYWRRNGTNLYPSIISDFVGLNVTSPAERLHIRNGNLFLDAVGNNDARIFFGEDNSKTYSIIYNGSGVTPNNYLEIVADFPNSKRLLRINQDGVFEFDGNIINTSGIATQNIRLISGANSNYILTSDSNGNASWQAPSAGDSFNTSLNDGAFLFASGGGITGSNTIAYINYDDSNRPVTINTDFHRALTISGKDSIGPQQTFRTRDGNTHIISAGGDGFAWGAGYFFIRDNTYYPFLSKEGKVSIGYEIGGPDPSTNYQLDVTGLGTLRLTNNNGVGRIYGGNDNNDFIEIDGTNGDYIGFNLNDTETARLTYEGKFGLGISTPAQKLHLSGTNNSYTFGPHVQFSTSASTHPHLQILPYTQDNVSLNFDSYWNGSQWTSSNNTSNYQILKASNLLRFRSAGSVSEGGLIPWTEGATLNTGGYWGFGTNSPSEKIHLYNQNLFLDGGNANGNKILFGENGVKVYSLIYNSSGITPNNYLEIVAETPNPKKLLRINQDGIFEFDGNITNTSGITTQNIRLISGASNGYVLTSDANGNARWEANAGGGGGSTIVSGTSYSQIKTISGNYTLNSGDDTIIANAPHLGKFTLTLPDVTNNNYSGKLFRVKLNRINPATTGLINITGTSNQTIDFEPSINLVNRNESVVLIGDKVNSMWRIF